MSKKNPGKYGLGGEVSRHRNVVTGPAQHSVEVSGRDGGAARAARVAAGRRAARAPPRHARYRARVARRAARRRRRRHARALAPLALQGHHFHR